MDTCITGSQYTEGISSFTSIVCSYSGTKPQSWPILAYLMQKKYKGPSIKDVCTKSRKIDTLYPMPLKCPRWLNPLPLCSCGHIINF